MDDMNITSAQYMIDNEAIQATMRQVEAGSLTIQPAE
jgi:hypothetical protein